jgi:hypothetical protein
MTAVSLCCDTWRWTSANVVLFFFCCSSPTQ